MKWNMLSKVSENSKVSEEDVAEILLKNRGFKTQKEEEEFLNPVRPEELTPKSVGIDAKELKKALEIINLAIKNQLPIVVYGDYDVDGICSTAILWETLRDLGARVMPFIPQREKEGYGLSIDGIKTILAEEKYGISEDSKGSKVSKVSKKGLLITVDNGIVANDAVDYANENNLEVIIVDHHELGEKLPKAGAIIHTLELCAGGISYIFSKELYSVLHIKNNGDKLELACIATVADLVPLVGPNRSIVKYGLPMVSDSTRPGLKALFRVAGIEKVGTYEIGYLIGPRINASGRIESALTALRLLCTNDTHKAEEYARILSDTNRERQDMTLEMATHAIEIQSSKLKIKSYDERIIVIDDEKYHQGVIGLIAGKLVEKYYLPAIVISKGETISKASARSINGFNIIEAIRSTSSLLINAGGHPMAAGFTIETERIADFKLQISDFAKKFIADGILEKSLKIDLALSLENIDLFELYEKVNELAPFGISNPEPVFASKMKIKSLRTVGAEGKHLKLVLGASGEGLGASKGVDAIAFGMGNFASKLKEGDIIELAYCLALDTFNGNYRLQLKVKDLKHE